MTQIDKPAADTMKKHVFFIGPKKTGTSWINSYLERRDDVVTPHTTKETFFFDRYFSRGPEWYEAQFRPTADEGSVFVECAPSYAGAPEAIARICKTVPNATFVITLREPVARVQSHWKHLIRYGHQGKTPLDAMSPESELFLDSQYADILSTAIAHAPPGQVFVILYEDLKRDPLAFARSVCHAVGVPEQAPDTEILGRQVNGAQKPRNVMISAAAAKGAEVMRNAGLHRVVRIARKSGLRNLLERPYNADEARLDTETQAAIREKLSQQMLDTAEILRRHPTLAPLGNADTLAQKISDWAQ
ncbi:sulfotransferase [Salipiger sp. PrR002]|uniref:sulfotransferase family protein n=1 Tax=Salipiger sp. PrR002 TaxID=2706489 RepID=UPI0013B8D5FF|nr:sulfotransferase [Salipiger sp. PrR002]NDW00439.1 hypothetical protein [Salipiger sp. PrR002]NDW56397.1 hypothetical protein [Salipiger sp. PrR004]